MFVVSFVASEQTFIFSDKDIINLSFEKENKLKYKITTAYLSLILSSLVLHSLQ